jgi:hypothetical protein
MNADFRRLKLSPNGTHVLDEIPGTRKRQCEVFSPLPLSIVGIHCTCLPRQLCQVSEGYNEVMPSQQRGGPWAYRVENHLTQSVDMP